MKKIVPLVLIFLLANGVFAKGDDAENNKNIELKKEVGKIKRKKTLAFSTKGKGNESASLKDKEKQSAPKSLPIEFFKPFLEELSKPNGQKLKIKGRGGSKESDFQKPETKEAKAEAEINIEQSVLVHISGKTLPKSKVYVPQKQILILGDKNKIFLLDTKSATVGYRVATADKNGYFSLSFKFPFQQIQLPIKIIPPKNLRKKFKNGLYQLGFAVNADSILVTSHKNLKESPLFSNKYGLWFGVGANFLIYEQKSDEVGTDLTMQTFKLPTFFGKFWYKINDEWNTNFTVNVAPGEISKAEGDLTIGSKSDYNWLIFVVEGSYYPQKWKYDHFGGEARVGTLFGIQHHIVPFLASTGASETEVEIKTNDMSVLTGGGQYLLNRKKWVYEIFMRYQIPFSTGSVFDITPQFAFDGSVGAFYKYSKNWKIGCFWYGQWHQYSYSYTDKFINNNPSAGTNPVEGDQTLFFSNIEARVGYEW